MEEERMETPKKSKSSKFLLATIIVLISLVGYAGAYYYYTQYKQTKIVLDNPSIASQKEVKDVTDALGKIYALPEGDEPTVATVLDKEKLKDQAFFAKAENGDKVLIFTKSQLAILYRVSSNKVINVAPVSLQNQQTNETPTPSAKATPKAVATPEATP